MRKSTKYLMKVHVRFVCLSAMTFIVILTFLKFVESLAKGGYGPIHDSLEFYVLLLAFLGSTSALIAMLEYYFTMRSGETSLSRYLARLGVKV